MLKYSITLLSLAISAAFITNAEASPEASRVEMARYAGTPREFGKSFGQRYHDRLQKSQKVWLKRAEANKISSKKLLAMAMPMVKVVEKIAPHWIEEASAAAEAAGLDRDLYIAQMFYIGPTVTGGRGWFRPELQDDCTTYTLSRQFTEGKATFFHRTRDNSPGKQTGAIWELDVPGVNKFMAVTYTGSKSVSVMVNEKGLAASADMGGPSATKSKDTGMMNGLMLRYIAEKASDTSEALKIVEEFVENGWYAGGKPGTRWTFTDSRGITMDVSHSSDKGSVSARQVETKSYITRTWGGIGGKILETLNEPVTFTDFRRVSRNPGAKINKGRNSIAGMTIKIHPKYPEYLTSAWFSFPAASLAFPLYMGGTKTPLPLLDGSIYELCAGLPNDCEAWEKMEKKLFSKAALLEKKVEELIEKKQIPQAREMIDRWTGEITAEHLLFLEKTLQEKEKQAN